MLSGGSVFEAIFREVAVADGEGAALVEQAAVVAACGWGEIAQGFAGVEEVLQVVGFVVTEAYGFAYHLQDVGFVEQKGVYGGANFKANVAMGQQVHAGAEAVEEDASPLNFPGAGCRHFVVHGDVVDQLGIEQVMEYGGVAAVGVDFDEISESFDACAKLPDIGVEGTFAAGKYHGIQKATALAQEGDHIPDRWVLGECQVGVVAIGTTEVAPIVPEDARSSVWIIQKGQRRDVRGLPHLLEDGVAGAAVAGLIEVSALLELALLAGIEGFHRAVVAHDTGVNRAASALFAVFSEDLFVCLDDWFDVFHVRFRCGFG